MQKSITTRSLHWGFAVLATGVLVAIPYPALADSYDDVVNSAQSGQVYVDNETTGFSNQPAITSALQGENIAVLKVEYDSQSESLSLQDAANQIVSKGIEHVIIVGENPAHQTTVFLAPADSALLGEVFVQGTNVDAGVLQLVQDITTEQVVVPTQSVGNDNSVGTGFGIAGGIVGILAAAGAVIAIVRSRKSKKPVELRLSSVQTCEGLANNIKLLTQQLQQNNGRLPQQVTSKTLQILQTVQDTVKEWNQIPTTADTQHTLDRVVTEYLPSAINSYLRLPNSYLSRNRQKTESNLNEQLDILQDAMEGVQDAVFSGVEDEIVTQTKFLKEKFPQDKSSLRI